MARIQWKSSKTLYKLNVRNLLLIIVLFVLTSLSFDQPPPLFINKNNNEHFDYIRGKKQHIVTEGKGNPTVIFVSGKGRTLDDFITVFNKIKKRTRIFAYDRAGLGQSESLNNERTVDTMAYELNELLIQEKIEPPFILVGHSMGAFIIRCFENMYPKKVAGLVFIDAACELDFKKGIEMRSESDKIKYRRGFDSLINVPTRPKGINDESKYLFDFDKEYYSTNSKIVKGLKIPNNIPITAFVSTQIENDNPYSKNEKEIRLNYFKSWKNQAPQVRLIETSKSGHCIQCDEPNLIIEGITEMVNEIKNK